MVYSGRTKFNNSSDNEKNSYASIQPGMLSHLMTARLVKDKVSTEKRSVENEDIDLKVGAAGTTGVFSFKYDFILNKDGTYLGMFEDSSIEFAGSILTTEIEYKGENPSVFLEQLNNGEYGIDYLSGICFYKKATSGTTSKVDYLIRVPAVSINVDEINIENVDISAFQDTSKANEKAVVYSEEEDLSSANKVNFLGIGGVDKDNDLFLSLNIKSDMTDAVVDEKGTTVVDPNVKAELVNLNLVDFATEETLSKLLGNFLLDKKDHNSIELEYIADGNGKGEIGEVKYYKDTDLLYTLTLTYDSENRLTKVERVDENEN